MLFHPAALPLSRPTLDYTAGIIRRQIASCGRNLNPGRLAAWRYVTETVALLAARAPKRRQALEQAENAGHAYLVIDGTLIPIDRVAANRPSCSGRHRKHGMNLQVIASPDGDIVRVSGPLPGAVHDLTRGPDLRHRPRAGRQWAGRAGRQGLPGRGRCPHPVPGTEQAGPAEGGQPGSCPAARPCNTTFPAQAIRDSRLVQQTRRNAL
jgi:hypothetical protein